MAYINDTVFDTGLALITANADNLDICSAEPANYAGIAAVTLGTDTVTVGAAGAGSPSGRKVTVPAITAGSVTGTGTAAFWALHDGTATLYASGPLTATQGVTSGNSFTLDAIDITITDATAV